MDRFAEHRTHHNPTVTRGEIGGLHYFSLREPSSPSGLPLDDLRLLELSPTLLRFVVADPVLGHIDAARIAYQAGQCALDELARATTLEQGFRSANSALYAPGASRSTSISMSCLLAVDFDLQQGALTAVRAGDCQLMVRRGDVWFSPFDHDILTPEAAEAWRHAAPQRDRPAHLADHDRILGHPAAWLCAPLGQFADPITQSVSLTGVDALTLGSDGLPLSPEAIADLPAAWRELHNRPDTWPHHEPHGDLAYALISPDLSNLP